ncbi:hypothetical protein GC163_12165 [bacterium]|nr:hypothetical protein [bacterium]
MNTITEEGVESGLKTHGANIIATAQMTTCSLNDLLNEYVNEGQTIHFLSIDVEGLDHDILSSFDFRRYSPWVICFEDRDACSGENLASPTIHLLQSQGYSVAGVTPLSVIMKKDNV